MILATLTGFEPVISAVTGRRDSQLRYKAIKPVTGIEPVSSAWKTEMLTVTPHGLVR